MTCARLIFRSLAYHWRTDACIAMGLAVATAVITGSLLVGDSMTATLRHNALRRLGNIDQALIAPHFFRAALAGEIAPDAAAVIIARGGASPSDADWGIPDVSILGIDDRFWKLFPGAHPPPLRDDAVAINVALAGQLHVKAGDEIVVSFDRPSPLADDNLFSQRKNRGTLLATVAAVVDDDAGGDFATDARATAPRNVFIGRSQLAKLLQHADSANAILAATPVSPDDLARHLQPADYGLTLAPSGEGGYVGIESASLLLTPRQIEAAEQAAADLHAAAAPTSAYLATRIADKDRSISYAMVATTPTTRPLTRISPSPGPKGAASTPAEDIRISPSPGTPGEGRGGGDSTRPLSPAPIALNNWAAADLSAVVGDELELTYFVPTAGGEYHSAGIKLNLSDIVDLSGAYADRHLTPALNGMTDAKRIDKWDMPFPITEKISNRDEQYWTRYGPTPKAFVDPQTMRQIWASALPANAGPAGAGAWVTSMRIIPGNGMALNDLQSQLGPALLRHLTPPDGQLAFRPLRAQILASAAGSSDFGQLFLYLSFFLIAAAAALSAMLLRLQAEQRSAETGMMLASGFRPRQISLIGLAEGGAVALAGAVIGLPFGVIYNICIIAAMNRWWMQPWGNARLVTGIGTSSLLIGGGGGLVLGLLCTLWALRGLRKKPILRLLSGRQAVAMPTPSRWRGILPLAAAAITALLLILASIHAISPEAGFFAGGAAALLTILSGFRAVLHRPLRGGSTVTLALLARRNAAANPARSLATLGVLAAASFILVAVAANRRDLSRLDSGNPASGAGGFALRATTSVPLHYDLNSPAGRTRLGFSKDQQKAMDGVTVVPLPESPGDDVSCLNLSRPMQPRLLGVTPQLIERNAFTVELADPGKTANPWTALQTGEDSELIPAFGDADSVQWILHSGLGKTFAFTAPSGRQVKLKIAGVIHGSIFAGELLVSQANLRRIYPDVNGSSYFLLSSPPGQEDQLTATLRSALSDDGIDVQPTGQILARVLSVQNIYLSIFMTLGGLGLLLGTAGLIAVIFRSMPLERRGELALMSAAGFARVRLVRLLLLENAGLLLAGILSGTAAALLAVAPALASADVRPNWPALALVLLSVAAMGMICCMLASHYSIPATPAAGLREE